MNQNKKNVTVALNDEEYSYLEIIKSNQRTRSYTHTISFLIQFYKNNHEVVELIEGNKKSILERMDNLERQVGLIKKDHVGSNELNSIHNAIDLLVQNSDITKKLVDKLENIQSNKVTHDELTDIKTRISNQEELLSTITSDLIKQGIIAMKENDQIKALIRAREKMNKEI